MSFLRDAALLAMGELKFTKNGFYDHAKSFDSHAFDINLSGRTYVVTGGTEGVGKSLVEFLLSKGARVHMLAPEEQKAQHARDLIVQKVGQVFAGNLVLHIVDLSDLPQIRQFCSFYVESGEKIDALIHNASVYYENRTVNKDGLEMMFCINLLANFILTSLLLPVLTRSAPARVICTTSPSFYSTRMHPTKLITQQQDKYDADQVYCETKRGLVLLCERWSSIYADTGVKFFSVHPGWINSPDTKNLHTIDYEKLRNDEEGSDCIKWLCVSPIVMLDDTKYNGSVFFDREVARKHLPAAMTTNTDEDVNKMWELLCQHSQWNVTDLHGAKKCTVVHHNNSPVTQTT